MIALIEKQWDAQLFGNPKGLAPTLGWQSYHTLRSKGSASGYPDRTIWRERLIFAELKTDAKASQPTERQIHVLTGLAAAGAEVYLWRPSDLDEIGQVLGSRAEWKAPTRYLAGCLSSRTLGIWTPGSLWLPTGHRADQPDSTNAKAISDALSAA